MTGFVVQGHILLSQTSALENIFLYDIVNIRYCTCEVQCVRERHHHGLDVLVHSVFFKALTV